MPSIPQSVNLSALIPEEKLLLRRLEDIDRIAADSGRSRFSAFLTEREAQIAEAFARQRGTAPWMLYGGYGGAERRVYGVFSDYEEPEGESFPIEAVTIRLPKGESPTHRDVLGSLMALKIKRESVGDILIDIEGRRCDVFALDTVAPLIIDELKKIGRMGVRCEIGAEGNYARADSFQELRGTVATPRLDAVTSILTGLSREKSAELIRAELVRKNHIVAYSVFEPVEAEDVISIRGYGKFIVDAVGSPTRKGRLPIHCRKYL